MEQKTNIINLIEDWRATFGLPVRTEIKIPSQEEMFLACELVQEEAKELEDALIEVREDKTTHVKDVKNISINEVADAIGDLYFAVTQVANIFGLDPEELVQKVYDSNMSKLLDNEIDADKSIKAYKEKGIDTYYIKLSTGKYIIKRLGTNKVLKGINFFEPKWNYNK